MYTLLNQDIQYLKGVGPNRARVLNTELEVFTVKDLLFNFPIKYIDRSKLYSIRELSEEMQYVQLKGQLMDVEEVGIGRARRVEATFTDGTGLLKLVWFRSLKQIQRNLKLRTVYLLLGKPTLFNGMFSISHPEMEVVGDDIEKLQLRMGLRPLYRVTDAMRRNGITSHTVEDWVTQVLGQLKEGEIRETLPEQILLSNQLMGIDEAVRTIHRPDTLQCIPRAEERFKFEELFYLQLNIAHYAKVRSVKYRGHLFKVIGENFLKFYHENLPFSLTEAQKRVVREIRKDVGSGQQMNRLLQGDVGSGKTIVALMAILMAIDNGYQACMMAPTEILAEQHCKTLVRMLQGLPLNVQLLTSTVKGKTRKAVLEGVEDGSVHVLVGTHAVLGDIVNFKNLGLAVIDEQHRFGVVQRAKLWQKNETPPHILVMTATPIPRTLAMTVYGDLDVSIIDELPPGRKPIKTLHFYDKNIDSLLQLIRQEVAAGHQAYFVYPLIKESEKLDLKNLEKGYEQISALLPEMKICMLHGKMKSSEKNSIMQAFIKKEYQVLVSTTVIEVGVDVPNASVMVIENSERFGLAQLHQLRGRVGRGAEQSYCILTSGYQLGENTRRRLEIMCDTTDGFRIAEEDLKLRGPGDLEGTLQSGMFLNLKIAHITRDTALMEKARDEAIQLVEEDPTASLPQYQVVWEQLKNLKKTRIDWSSIS